MFVHVGLLHNKPAGIAGLPFIKSPDFHQIIAVRLEIKNDLTTSAGNRKKWSIHVSSVRQ
jgi:hypothetical protein